MRKMVLVISVLTLAVSCVRIDVAEALLNKDDVSLTVKGVDQFIYEPGTCQMAHKPETNEFRVYDDKISKWFIVKCDEKPSAAGQVLTADLTWTASSSTDSLKDLSFKVEKIDDSGKIWLWCGQKNIGIVIKNL